jgi:TonB family protein
MFRELFGSRPARRIRPRPVLASVVVHSALITAVIVTTRGIGSDAHGRNHVLSASPLLVPVRYLTSAQPEKTVADVSAANLAPSHAAPVRKSRAGELIDEAKASLASLKASLDAVTARLATIQPAFDLARVMRSLDADYARLTVDDSEFNNGAAIRLSDAFQIVPTTRNGIYTPDLVDEQVMQRPGNPRPDYPQPLRAAGIETDVDVRFVVDTTGRVVEPTIEFKSHVHRLFMDAIRASLHRARFFPAKFAGVVRRSAAVSGAILV